MNEDDLIEMLDAKWRAYRDKLWDWLWGKNKMSEHNKLMPEFLEHLMEEEAEKEEEPEIYEALYE